MSADPAAAQRAGDLAAIFADRVAFRAWYEDAVVRVYRYLYPRCGGDAALAEELTQQTFISAIERRSTYEGRSSPITWLCTIARNKLADHYRAVDRQERRHAELPDRQLQAGASQDLPVPFPDHPSVQVRVEEADVLAERLVALAQLIVGLELELGFVVVDAGDVLLEGLELLRLADPERTLENGHQGYGSNARGRYTARQRATWPGTSIRGSRHGSGSGSCTTVLIGSTPAQTGRS
jgi:RNA polymerase sigma factor (sigma-70 family)